VIAYLEGILSVKKTDEIVVLAGGVGYRLFIPLPTFFGLPEVGEKVALLVHTHHREDDFSLFGFLTERERELFLALQTVKGIGPKLSRNILSGMAPEELEQAIAGEDLARVQSIPGVGPKTASRILLELRGKIVVAPEPAAKPSRAGEPSQVRQDAVSALVNLGYKKKDAEAMVEKVDDREGTAPLPDFIRDVLRYLSGGRR
jgi:Holliday junction DNA helicase RuvA